MADWAYNEPYQSGRFPKALIAQLAEACGWIGETDLPQKSKVDHLLKTLQKDGFTKWKRGGKWALTEKGKKEAKDVK